MLLAVTSKYQFGLRIMLKRSYFAILEIFKLFKILVAKLAKICQDSTQPVPPFKLAKILKMDYHTKYKLSRFLSLLALFFQDFKVRLLLWTLSRIFILFKILEIKNLESVFSRFFSKFQQTFYC